MKNPIENIADTETERDNPPRNMDNIIKTGDQVCVNFNNSQYTLCSRAVVEWIPTETGDSWIFRDMQDGRLHYVSEGCTITLLKKRKD